MKCSWSLRLHHVWNGPRQPLSLSVTALTTFWFLSHHFHYDTLLPSSNGHCATCAHNLLDPNRVFSLSSLSADSGNFSIDFVALIFTLKTTCMSWQSFLIFPSPAGAIFHSWQRMSAAAASGCAGGGGVSEQTRGKIEQQSRLLYLSGCSRGAGGKLSVFISGLVVRDYDWVLLFLYS